MILYHHDIDYEELGIKDARVPLSLVAMPQMNTHIQLVAGYRLAVLDYFQQAIKQLSPSAFVIYMALACKLDNNFEVQASIADIIERTSISSNATVVKAVNELEEKGFFWVDRSTGEANTYKFLIVPVV